MSRSRFVPPTAAALRSRANARKADRTGLQIAVRTVESVALAVDRERGGRTPCRASVAPGARAARRRAV